VGQRAPQQTPSRTTSGSHLHRTIELPFYKRAATQNIKTAMVKAEISRPGDTESSLTGTVPPKLAPQSQSSFLTPHPVRTAASPFPIIQRPQSSPPHAISERDGSPGPISDLMPHLHRSAPSIVKTRSGSVLSRGFILKTDHYPSGKQPVNYSRLLQNTT
jgi:hypothetical protein